MRQKSKQIGQNLPFWLKIFLARCARGKKNRQFGAGRRPAEQNFDHMLPDRAVTADIQCVSLAYFAEIVL